MVSSIHAFKHTCALQHLELGRKAFAYEKRIRIFNEMAICYVLNYVHKQRVKRQVKVILMKVEE